jgi:CheY-like chemotaxis protein
VIAVTASAFGNTRQAARDAGCTEYLPKPVRAEALFAALQHHLGVEFVREETADPADVSAIAPAPGNAALAARLREAAAIGNITDLHVLAGTLASGDQADAAMARRIGALAASFDFEGVRALADALETARDPGDGR